MKRRTVALTAAGLVVLGASVPPAAAAWNAPGTGSGAARAAALSAPGAAPVTVTSAGTHLTWTAPGSGTSPAGYLVTRNGATVCTTTTTSCDEGNLAPGTTYTYLVSSTTGRYWVSATPLTLTARTAAGGFTISSVSATNLTAGVGLTFTVTASYGAGTTDTAYSGPHPVTITSSLPPSPGGKVAGGQITPVFTAGVTTKVATNVYNVGAQTLTVSDGSRTGSLAVSVTPAAASMLELTNAVGSAVECLPGGHVTIAAGAQLTARVIVIDAYGNATTPGGNALAVSLSFPIAGALSPTSVTIPGNGSLSAQFTLTMPTGATKSGVLSISTSRMSTTCSVN